jgi:hypothetical protein
MDALPLAPVMLACECRRNGTPHDATTLPTVSCTLCGRTRRITRADLDDLLRRATRFVQALAETGICQACSAVGLADNLTTIDGRRVCEDCFPATAIRCESCALWTARPSVVTGICQPCAERQGLNGCQECGRVIPEGRHYCTDCEADIREGMEP